MKMMWGANRVRGKRFYRCGCLAHQADLAHHGMRSNVAQGMKSAASLFTPLVRKDLWSRLGAILSMVAVMVCLVFPVQAHAEKATYYVTDAQGTVVATMNGKAQVIHEAAYRPYGKQAKGSPQDGPGYTGHVNDAATGLVYMQQRYYDPEVGQFLSPDPVVPAPGNVFNFGRYVYANDNPVRFIDLDGRSVTCDDSSCTISAGDSAAEFVADWITVGVIAATQATTNAAGGNVSPKDAQGEVQMVGSVFNAISLPNLVSAISSSSKSSDKKYYPAPKNISGVDGLKPAKPKTPVQGGGGLRKRWKGPDGKIYEWDSQHGTVEVYGKNGKHLGEIDPDSGKRVKPKNKKRRIEK